MYWLWIALLALVAVGAPREVAMAEANAANEGFEATEGLDLIWKLQADPANVVFSPVVAELQGMAYYDAEYRWPAVRGANGSITVTVPRAGTFHPAVVVYDTAGAEGYEVRVDGKPVGRFVAAEDDRRQRVHFLRRAIPFKGGEKLSVHTDGTGAHITEDLLLLARPPEVRGRRFEVSQVGAACTDRDGPPRARVTWITTWPAACTVECGGVTVTEEKPVANHRIVLEGLEPGKRYRARITAPRPDGTKLVVESREFTFAPPAGFAGTARRERAPLKVENPYGFALSGFPVTSGVPFARGELGDPANARLLDAAGREVLLQARVTARWQDGSIKWLLLTFLADAGAQATATYTLEYGTQVKRADAESPLGITWMRDVLTVENGPLRVRFDKAQSGFPTRVWPDADGDSKPDADGFTGDLHMGVQVTDAQGEVFSTNNPPESIELEEAGPVRLVVKTKGHHLSEGNTPFFTYENRFVFYAGSPMVQVLYTWGNDWAGAEFATFKGISFHLPLPQAQEWAWSVGLGDGKEAEGKGALALAQIRDDSFRMAPAPPAEAAPRRADGWLSLARAGREITLAARDFWQLYPKGLRVDDEGAAIDIAPEFPAGTYDGCSKLDEVKLYYYLMGGQYKVRRGVRKQHEWLLLFQRDPEARGLARAFQEPLIAVCAPERYCDTRVFGEILPATAGRTPEYEKVCEGVYTNYVAHRERGHEYGMLNFGDWFGERKYNWANGEYDNHHAFLMQFIRTGDRRWYFLGERAARHAIDVDTCHYGPRAGGEWVHAMGHTGDYFGTQFEGDGIPRGGFSPSHTWTEGFCDWYFLSGDPTAMENAALVADYYDGAYLSNYDFSNCRDNGWHLLFTLAAYRATDDPYYLNAARIIVERTLERQSPGGGWHRQMVPGHCHDMPRHRGEANFMLGVLANGLEEYYREVADPRVAQAVIGGAKQAVAELWVEEANGFRYTSCPNMKGYVANNDMTAEVLFFAHRLGGDARFAEIALRAMDAAFKDGIGSAAHIRWTPHLIYNMDLLRGKRGNNRE